MQSHMMSRRIATQFGARFGARLGVRCGFLALLLTVMALGGSGCGYALAGRGSALPAYIRTIGVPLFTNGTSVFNLEQTLTQRVRLEFLSRGKYQVQPDATGDAVLTGEIVSVNVTPTAFNTNQQASRYAFILVVKVEFKDLKANKVLYENAALSFREEYEITSGTTVTDANAFLGQNVSALDRIANDFARTAVSAVLEAF